VPTAFQGLKCVRGGLKRRKYQVRARYQVKANPLLDIPVYICEMKLGGTCHAPAAVPLLKLSPASVGREMRRFTL